MSVPSSSAGSSSRPKTLNGGTSAKAIGTLRRMIEPTWSSRIVPSCRSTVLPVTPVAATVQNLYCGSAEQLVAQREVADRDFRAGVDHRVERQAGGPDLGQDQLAVLQPGGDHDFVGVMRRGLRASSTLITRFSKSIISRCRTRASIPIMPSPPRSASRKRRDLEIVDRARAEGQRGDLDPIDDVAVGHAVEDHRRAERQLQVAGDAQADRRSIGAAVDHEMIGSAAVDLDLHRHPGFDLARIDVVAADRELVVDRRRRQRRHGRMGRAAPASAC